MYNKKVIIIRGLPGAGKSTMALKSFVSRGYVHCEADHYFHRDGKYVFEPGKTAEAHEYCINKAIRAIEDGKKVVISNTFTRKWEIQEVLQKLSVDPVKDVSVLNVVGGTGSVNGVPEHVMERMSNRWQPWHREVKVTLDPVSKTKVIRA